LTNIVDTLVDLAGVEAKQEDPQAITGEQWEQSNGLDNGSNHLGNQNSQKDEGTIKNGQYANLENDSFKEF